MRFYTSLTASALALFATSIASPLVSSALDHRASTPAPGITHSSEFQTLGCPNTTSRVATEAEQFTAANAFAQTLFISKQISQAFSTYVASDLINHAYDVPGDGAAIAQAQVAGLVGAGQFELQWVNVGQNIATTFFKVTTPKGVGAAVEMFRMSGTCLVEHWVIQQAVTNSSNPHPFF